jgi:hypothetical protein
MVVVDHKNVEDFSDFRKRERRFRAIPNVINCLEVYHSNSCHCYIILQKYIFSVKRFCVALSSQSWFIFLQKLMESMLKKSTQDVNQGFLSFATQEI